MRQTQLREQKMIKRNIWTLCFGGSSYYLIELLWRGESHWSMFFVGGICFRLIGLVRTFPGKWNLFLRCAFAASMITAIEFISGCILNLQLHWDIWDYSELPFNLLGQICLPFTALWGVLSLPAFWADQALCKRMNS